MSKQGNMAWQAAPVSGKAGRPAKYGNAAVQCCLTVEIKVRPSRGGLHLLVDSTGIKMLGERVMAHTFERQVVELQVRAAVLAASPTWAPRVTRAVA